MDERTEVLERDIEETRRRLGETADAIGYRADVPSRVRDGVSDRAHALKDRVGDAVGAVSGRVSDATPSTGEVQGGARRAVGIAQENPLGLAIGSIAAGFLLGLMLPATRMEREHVGPAADAVRERATEMGREVLEEGRAAGGELLESAKEHAADLAEEARERVGEHASAVQERAKESAGAAAGEVKDAVTSGPGGPGSGGGR